MDKVVDFYSKPRMVGGALKVASRKQDRYTSYGIPLYGKTKIGVEEAVNAAAGGTIKKFVREHPKAGKRHKLKAGSKKLQQRFTDDGVASMGPSESETDDDEKPKRKRKKKVTNHKRKRSRIDDVLGDDSY